MRLARRRLLAVGGAALLGAAPTQVSQAAAHYQDTPKDGQTCGQCTLFRPPAACTVVAGAIGRDGWCQLFDMVD